MLQTFPVWVYVYVSACLGWCAPALTKRQTTQLQCREGVTEIHSTAADTTRGGAKRRHDKQQSVTKTAYALAKVAAREGKATRLAQPWLNYIARLDEQARRVLPAAQSVGRKGGSGELADAALSQAAESEGLRWSSWADYEKESINGRLYARIGARYYTEHAVLRTMPRGFTTQGRSISPAHIEEVIQNGEVSVEIRWGIERQKYQSGTVEVQTEQNGKIVVSVNPYKVK